MQARNRKELQYAESTNLSPVSTTRVNGPINAD